ncbi:MAG: alanine--tRNA ligase, partial [Clostridia bacterium]|nr:alanine--tRNA ligase [Clostridia bacterium]
DVYMQYKKTATGYEELANKNVDTGFGLDRLLLFLNGFDDGYKTDLFAGAIKRLEEVSGKSYGENDKTTKAMRIIADHIRTSTMLIGDVNGIVPSNVGAGYILRRLLRRAIRYARTLGISPACLTEVSKIFIEKIYDEAYPLLVEKEDYIIGEIAKETEKFENSLANGLKEFNKCIDGIKRKNEFMSAKDPAYVPETKISGKQAFRLYDTFGFPLELTEELAAEVGYTVDAEGFTEAFKEHQEISKQQGTFKGGLAEQNETTAKLHTATHLLNAALKSVLCDDNINQKGSNITVERLRFDFNFPRKLEPAELVKIENWVNDAIKADAPITMEEMSFDEAKAQGAIGVFESKYGEKVKVYTMGKFSKEICGGPHANSTGELHHFKIVKEEASSAGVRRIKAIID